VAEALSSSHDRDTRSAAAALLARTGDANGSEKLAGDLAKEFPNDTLLNSVWIPIVRASNEMRRDPPKAISLLEAARSYELGAVPNGCDYWPNYVRGEGFLKAQDGTKAAAEYQKILDHRGINPTSPLYTLARLGLGRGLRAAG